MKEEWKVYPENPTYEVSNLGRVRRCISWKMPRGGLVGKGHLLKPRPQPDKVDSGLFVYLNKSGSSYPYQRVLVAKMVLITFVSHPPYPMKQARIGYKDGDKHNCKLSNLYWLPKQTEPPTVIEKLQTIRIKGEKWKLFPDQDNYYISNLGRIYSVKTGKEPPLWRKPGRREYRLPFTAKDKLPTCSIGRLVLLSWKGPPPGTDEHYIASHKDGDASNNRLENLEWAPKRLGYYKLSLEILSAQKQIDYAERKVKRIEDKLAYLEELGYLKKKHKITMRDTLKLRDNLEMVKSRKEKTDEGTNNL
jgi:hypothetical protein